jgi:hypothetical protein
LSQAYTPGLIVSGWQTVQKERRLPMHGEVLVQVGQNVIPSDVVARTYLPGLVQTIKLSEKLGIDIKEAKRALLVEIGQMIQPGDLIAESKGLFGWFKTSVFSDYGGTIESFSDLTGHLFIRQAPVPLEINAYVEGKVVEILGEDGTMVETKAALIQGIFGVGGERQGKIRVAVHHPYEQLNASHILSDDQGKILIGGSRVDSEAIKKAEEIGVSGIVVGSILDKDLTAAIGQEIGVAVTGQENISYSLMITEGFGDLSMNNHTFELLQKLDGKQASMNGTTQIRAGVIRPEVIVPLNQSIEIENGRPCSNELNVGSMIRIIREPYFGQIAQVTELPAELMLLESGVEARVLKANLKSGTEVTVPRANIELLRQ